MHLAVDVGYSHVKAAGPSGRVLIPSVVAPYRELPLADLSRNETGHVVAIRRVDGSVSRYFVGELALREGKGATFTLDREKHLHPNHDVLLLAAARLLGAGANASVVVGLPVAYYRNQKDELRRHVEGLHAEVSVNGGHFVRVSFGKVVVYPQAAGALLAAPDLPEAGLVLAVDVGYRTTDYVTAEVRDGQARPVASLCGSAEVGVFNVHEALCAEYQVRTGAPLSPMRASEIARNGGLTYYYGRELDLSGVLEKARAEVARQVADQVRAALADRLAEVRKVYLVGGGALELPFLARLLPAAEVLPDPQWANAAGFLRLA
jgi:plasmid segregation protein ParM